MTRRKYFWKTYISGAFVLLLLTASIYLLNRPYLFTDLLSKVGVQFEQSHDPSQIENAFQPAKVAIPISEFRGFWVYKPNYLLFYDPVIMQARFTLHRLKAADTRGNANRYGIRFNENEAIGSGTAAYRDYSGSGYDRGHLVPAGDFQCCQPLQEETFAMSNIAPFDSVLNRYAWNELEIKIRSWARKNDNLYVITGPLFEHQLHLIGRYNDVAVPTHFFKLIFTLDPENKQPVKTLAVVLPNVPLYDLDLEKVTTSIDELERISELDFFQSLPDVIENKMEKAIKNGSW